MPATALETKKPQVKSETALTKSATGSQEPDVTVHDDIADVPPPEPSHDEIAALAYLYWVDGGQQHGLAEQYWLRAERDLRARRTGNSDKSAAGAASDNSLT